MLPIEFVTGFGLRNRDPLIHVIGTVFVECFLLGYARDILNRYIETSQLVCPMPVYTFMQVRLQEVGKGFVFSVDDGGIVRVLA